MISQVKVKVKRKKIRITSTKDHLGYTKVCSIKLNLKKFKSYHVILTAIVSTLFILIQDIVWSLRKMAGHGNLGTTCTRNHFGGMQRKSWCSDSFKCVNQDSSFRRYYQKENCAQFNPSDKTCSAWGKFAFTFLTMLSKSENSTSMKTWLRFSVIVSIPV